MAGLCEVSELPINAEDHKMGHYGYSENGSIQRRQQWLRKSLIRRSSKKNGTILTTTKSLALQKLLASKPKTTTTTMTIRNRLAIDSPSSKNSSSSLRVRKSRREMAFSRAFFASQVALCNFTYPNFL